MMAIKATAQITIMPSSDSLAAESPFYIPMTGPSARPRRTLKHDDTFVVLDSHGDIGASAGGPDGLFDTDTRYLARLELVLNDMQPLLRGSNLRNDNSGLTVDLTNPDIYDGGRIVFRKDAIHIVRTIFLWRGTAYQRIGIQNHGEQTASFDLSLLFDNDFADLFEVRGARAAASAPPNCPVPPPSFCPTSVSITSFGPRACISSRGRRAWPSTARSITSICRRSRPPQYSSVYPATSRRRRRPVRSIGDCWRIAAKCGAPGPVRRISKPRTTFSTRCCASRWPI